MSTREFRSTEEAADLEGRTRAFPKIPTVGPAKNGFMCECPQGIQSLNRFGWCKVCGGDRWHAKTTTHAPGLVNGG